MSDHPKFVAHSDWRETFRLSEVDDDTCKLVILTDDQLEILRRALKAARKRGNWIDSEDADGYMTPDDGDWDDTLALLDDLEYKLMSACDWITLDDTNERLGISEDTPSAKLHILADGDELPLRLENATSNPVFQFSDGTYVSYMAMRAGIFLIGDNITYGDDSGRVRIGPTGLGVHKSPSYALDVNGAARIYGAFGCNSQVPQSARAVSDNASDLNSAITLVNAIKAALVANGIVTG